MNSHVKMTDLPSTDLSRRSFLVGAAASGLMLGYAAMPDAFAATAAAGNFEPSVWFAISPDGLVTVTCGKADMGQHIASTMAQIVCEEFGARWSDMRVSLASNDPKFNDPVLGAQITGGSWSTMMNFDAMSRAGAAGRIALTEAAATSLGVPPSELVVRDSVISHPKSKKRISFADVVKSGKATKTFTPDEPKGDRAEVARPVCADRRLGAADRHSRQDQRHGQIRHRRHAAGHGLRQGRHPAGALRRHGEIRR
jgi:isoquinoline 1-oxidoreductase beta subunit